MSAKYDEVDWVGGFPYQFVGFETFTAYLEARGFVVVNSKKFAARAQRIRWSNGSRVSSP